MSWDRIPAEHFWPQAIMDVARDYKLDAVRFLVEVNTRMREMSEEFHRRRLAELGMVEVEDD